jgi:hypothetical protein
MKKNCITEYKIFIVWRDPCMQVRLKTKLKKIIRTHIERKKFFPDSFLIRNIHESYASFF